METGGMIYWSEIYPIIDNISSDDYRHIIIPRELKYIIIDIILYPFGKIIDIEFSTWEEHDICYSQLKPLNFILHSIETNNASLKAWVVKTTDFIEEAIKNNTDISIAL